MKPTLVQELLTRTNHNEIHCQIYISQILSGIYLDLLPILSARVTLEYAVTTGAEYAKKGYQFIPTEGASEVEVNEVDKTVTVPSSFFNNPDFYSALERSTLGRVLNDEHRFPVELNVDQSEKDKLFELTADYVKDAVAKVETILNGSDEHACSVIITQLGTILYNALKENTVVVDYLLEFETTIDFVSKYVDTAMLILERLKRGGHTVPIYSIITGGFLETVFSDVPVNDYVLHLQVIDRDIRNRPNYNPDIKLPTSDYALSLLWFINIRQEDIDAHQESQRDSDEPSFDPS